MQFSIAAVVSFLLPALVAAAPLQGESPASPLQKRADHSSTATWYNPSVGIGSCGWRNSDSDLVVAVNPSWQSGRCGRKMQVNSKGKSVVVTVVDTCPSCNGDKLDLSPAAFKALAPLSEGVIPVVWHFLA